MNKNYYLICILVIIFLVIILNISCILDVSNVSNVSNVLNNNIVKSYRDKLEEIKLKSEPIENNLSVNPINIIDNFISLNDCDELIKMSEGRFIDSILGKASYKDNKVRTSKSLFFKKSENDLIKKIENKVSKLLNVNQNQIERIQMTKYNKNDLYIAHYDFFASKEEKENFKENDRIQTIIVYLNDLDELDGGATYFPYHKIRIYPSKSRAIHFINRYKNDNNHQIYKEPNYHPYYNLMSLHTGEPILTDKTKYILNIWIWNKAKN